MIALIWFVIWLIRQTFLLFHPHATAWIQATLSWSQAHPKLREITAALADPDHPEAGGLAILATLLILTMGLSALIFGAVLGENGLAGIDQSVLQILQSLRTPWADHLMIHFSRPADIPVLIALTLGVFTLLAWQRRWRTAGYWLAAAGFGFLASITLKYSLQILRPDIGISGLTPYSFPSSHVLRATVLFGFLAVMIARAIPPQRRWLPYSLAGLLITPVAVSRLYLGVHWLTDVIAGLTLGLAWVSLLGIAYHRHTTVETRWQSLAAGSVLLLTLFTGIQTWRSHAADLALYSPLQSEIRVTTQAWWEQKWSQLPPVRQGYQGQAHPPPASAIRRKTRMATGTIGQQRLETGPSGSLERHP